MRLLWHQGKAKKIKQNPLSNITVDHSELIFAEMAFSELAAWQTGFSQNSFALE